MARFELLGGAHAEKCPKTGKRIKSRFTKGKTTIVHSNRDLVALFGPTNFRRLEDGRGLDSAPPAQPEPEEVAAPAGEAEAEDEAPVPPALGTDVTDEFAGAAAAGLLVFKADKGYKVALKADPAKSVFGAVESKSEVKSFVKKHALKGE